jgi:3-oxoacyl-[acyl-carrier protein] reductase
VTLSGTRREALDALAGELKDRVHVLPCDLGDAAAIEALAKDSEKAMGSIDILVNNAGFTRDNLAMRMKDEDWLKVLDVNLTASFRLSRACIRPMLKKRFGRIINITSVVASIGSPGQANYAASKAGLVGMSKALAQEVATRGITVNCLAPGFIETAMTESLPEERMKALLGATPVGRLGKPEDVAPSVVFLASEEAAFITGQTLHVNGGMAMI